MLNAFCNVPPMPSIITHCVQVSARAFVERPDKKGEQAGEVGIEGTTIEQPDKVRLGRGSAAPSF